MLSWRVDAHAAIDSTNEEARRQAEASAAEGLCVTALTQTAGRGRRGRAWESPEGNLFASLLLRPKVSAAEAAKLGFLTSLAVTEAVDEVAPRLTPRLACKWPNDVLLDGAKLSGILLESRTRADAGIDFVVVGIGVNLAWAPAGTPYPATSLKLHGVTIPPRGFLPVLLARYGAWYARWQEEGFAPVREAWLKRAQGIGRPVVVRLPDKELHGIFAALDETGALLLDQPDGGRQAVTAGDVFPAT